MAEAIVKAKKKAAAANGPLKKSSSSSNVASAQAVAPPPVIAKKSRGRARRSAATASTVKQLQVAGPKKLIRKPSDALRKWQRIKLLLTRKRDGKTMEPAEMSEIERCRADHKRLYDKAHERVMKRLTTAMQTVTALAPSQIVTMINKMIEHECTSKLRRDIYHLIHGNIAGTVEDLFKKLDELVTYRRARIVNATDVKMAVQALCPLAAGYETHPHSMRSVYHQHHHLSSSTAVPSAAVQASSLASASLPSSSSLPAPALERVVVA